MRRTERNSGFTLIEVSLAIVVGLLVIAGAVVLFSQSKLSAQNSAAKEKLMSLSLLAEEMSERNFGYPTLAQLQAAWKTRRPDDYNKSPWGGVVTGLYLDGDENIGLNQEIGDGTGGTHFGTPTVNDRGRLFYFRRDPTATIRPFIWLDEFNQFGPTDEQSITRVQAYGVACLGPDGKEWYYVEGKNKTNTAGGPLVTEGQIGN